MATTHILHLFYWLPRFFQSIEMNLKGTVKLCFQQAEEIGYGAMKFIKAGLVTGDRSFGIHLASNIPVGKVSATEGPNNASVDYFKITVKGRGALVSTP